MENAGESMCRLHHVALFGNVPQKADRHHGKENAVLYISWGKVIGGSEIR